ncbi:MAG: protein-glutamate O-methyltransferase CheR [Gemmatimonadota bacterium]|nr:protein-glutamate O-methyltransferase CheR [Gemmatimonadota bacterium]
MSALSPASDVPMVGATVSHADFVKISAILYDIAGIKLNDGKEGLVVSRLGKRMREVGELTFKAYIKRVQEDPAEMREMIDRLTTNKTSFFRESAHFDFLARTALPAWGGRDITIWSAGCSSGEEPYTIATVMYDFAQGGDVNGRILATDLSHRVLAKAKEGAYTAENVRDIPPQTLNRHFERQRDGAHDRWVAKPHLRSIIRFGKLNLMGDWPMKGAFDAIFCRNVMIYFDRETQERLVQRFSKLLAPDGYLFIGHSETLHSLKHDLRYVAPAAYAKAAS